MADVVPRARGSLTRTLRTSHFPAAEDTYSMHILLLKFTANRSAAGQFMEQHKAWIKRGFDDGVFLLVGSLEPELGGGIFAHNTTSESLRQRVAEDPFVREGIVTAEVLELLPGRVDGRLEFLTGA